MAEPDTIIPPDYNRGPEILVVCSTLVGVSVSMVLLRVWVRTKIMNQFGWDDTCMVAAAIVLLVEMMVIIPEVQLGAGRHVQYIQPPENITKGLHLNFVTQPLCLIALCLVKVSVGLFLYRLAASPGFKYFVMGTIVFTVLSASGNFLTVFFQCQPLAYTWDPTVPGGSCIAASNLKFAAFFNSGVSVLTDLIFALLPIPMLWNVQLNWRVKAAVAGILSLGIFATAAAIVKITFITNYGKHGDFLFDSSDLTIWTTVEICAGMVAACFPVLRPLFKAILTGSSAARYGSGKSAKGYIRSDGTNRAYNETKNTSTDESQDLEMYSAGGRTIKNRAEVGSGFPSDVDSEDGILPRDAKTHSGITKTTHVSVSVAEYHKKPKYRS